MIIDYATITAVLAVFGIGVIGLVQTLKSLFKLAGWKALVATGVVSAGATAFTLLTTSKFSWLAFVIYTALVFGEASGLYKFKNS